jgi:hypothetical protein
VEERVEGGVEYLVGGREAATAGARRAAAKQEGTAAVAADTEEVPTEGVTEGKEA